MTPHIVKICNLPLLHPPPSPILLTISKVLHFISKTLETVSVSQESDSFKPCAKAGTDFVEIKCLVFEACFRVSKILSFSSPPVLRKTGMFHLKTHIKLYCDTCLKHQPIQPKVTSTWSQFSD